MVNSWKIPPFTVDLIAKGEAILFLGSGASFECRTSGGVKALTASGLRDALCDTFLGGRGKTKSLAAVGDLATSAAGMLDMQRFVKDHYQALRATTSHLEIPRYRWKAIVTTNYDLAVEQAYELASAPMQRLVPIISDDDDFKGAIGDGVASVPLLKLHGCVTRAADTHLPLILSSTEYARFRNRRTRLFNYLKDWAYDYPIVFSGYSLADENVRDIMFDIFDNAVSHKRFVYANPDLIPEELALWDSRRVDAIPATFDQLFSYLRTEIPDAKLTLAVLQKGERGSLSKFIAGKGSPSPDLFAYLENEIIHVHQGMQLNTVSPADFYRGSSEGFGWILGNLDVTRGTTEELLIDLVINDSQSDGPEIFTLLGYAGSGKTIALKRFAWEAAVNYGKPTFYVGEGARVNFVYFHEIYQLINEPFYLVVDSALDHAEELADLIQQAKKHRVPVKVVCSERTNQWNVEGADLAPFVTGTYEVLDLVEAEVGELVLKLKKSGCLGYMASFALEEAISYLKSKLNNQLLVALHEATSGKSFAEIVTDEYTQIVPAEAQRLYLDICTVHRVGVPVRAGTISRVSGIRMEDFHRRLFQPLEHVVHTQYWNSLGDYVYKARHPSIADIVFDAAVPGEDARSAQLVRIIQSLNTGYNTDNEAVTKLIKARQLARDFSDKALAYAVFRAARDAGVSDEVVDQHIAQFELLHKNGDIKRARHLIDQAIETSRNSRPTKSTVHVKAAILRRQAKESRSPLERDKRRQEAGVLLDRLMSDKRDPHPFVLKADLLIDELEERLDDASESSAKIVASILRDIQSVLLRCRQSFPRDAFMSTVESRLATTMNEHPKATAILESAHKSDKHTTFLAIRLAERYASEGRSVDAERVLNETLRAAGPNKDVHFALAETLRSKDEEGRAEEIIGHLRRSFSEGDTRYQAQFLYARHNFLYGDRSKAESIFRSLERAKVSPQSIDVASEPIKDNGQIKRFIGIVGTLRPSFAFVRCASLGSDIYLHKKQVLGDWQDIRRGSQLDFAIFFSFRGPVAKDAQVTA
ncbi:SIR2 family protein [Xanthomonas sp. PPL139]|uniref:P-loop NTPase n=1 Tax=unclassified Xanthomonas TaxID=2643310 RepID=UPI0033B65DBC